MFAAKPDRWSQDMIIAGRVSDPLGFVTENREIEGLNGPLKVWFSVTGLRQLAAKHRQVGLVPVGELDAMKSTNATLWARLAQAEAEVEELRQAAERISGLSKDGFQVTRRHGPTPKKETA